MSPLREATLESGRTGGLFFTTEGMPWDRGVLVLIVEVDGLTGGGVKPTENAEAETADSLFGNWLTWVSVADALAEPLDEAGTDNNVDADAPKVWL